MRVAEPPAKGVVVEDAPETHNERPVLAPLVALGSVSDPPGPLHDRRSSRACKGYGRDNLIVLLFSFSFLQSAQRLESLGARRLESLSRPS